MDRVARVSKNAAALIVSKVATSVLLFGLVMLVNRELGPAQAGIYAYALALYTIFQVIGDFGLGSIYIRDVSRDKSRMSPYLSKVMSLRFVLATGAVVSLLAVNAISSALGSANDPMAWQRFAVVCAISLSLLVEQPVANSLAEVFITLERLTTVAIVYGAASVLRVGLSVYIVTSGAANALIWLMLAYLVSTLYTAAHLRIAYNARVRAAPKPRPESGPPVNWRYLLKSAWPVALVSGAIAVYAVIDIPILAWLKGDSSVGMYSAASMFAKAFAFLALAANMAILPAISMVSEARPENLADLREKLVRYALLLTIPMTVLAPVLARPLLVVQGHGYVDAWPVTWITMAAMNFTLMTAVTYPFFIAIDKQKLMAVVVLVGLGSKLVLNLVLVPLLDYTGAAIAMLASEFAVFAGASAALSRELGGRLSAWRFAAVPAVTLAFLYAVAFTLLAMLLPRQSSALGASARGAAIAGACLVAAYVGASMTTREFSKARLEELNELMKAE